MSLPGFTSREQEPFSLAHGWWWGFPVGLLFLFTASLVADSFAGLLLVSTISSLDVAHWVKDWMISGDVHSMTTMIPSWYSALVCSYIWISLLEFLYSCSQIKLPLFQSVRNMFAMNTNWIAFVFSANEVITPTLNFTALVTLFKRVLCSFGEYIQYIYNDNKLMIQT